MLFFVVVINAAILCQACFVGCSGIERSLTDTFMLFLLRELVCQNDCIRYFIVFMCDKFGTVVSFLMVLIKKYL